MGLASWNRLLVVGIFLATAAGCSGSSSSGSGDANALDPVEPAAPADDPADADGGDTTEPPTLALSAGDETVSSGDSTTLSWTSEGASSCEASGGWSGSQSVQGSTTVGPLNSGTTFTLTCEGSGGSSVAMISVAVTASVNLAWEPPAENEDGSPLTDLSGYRIYYGSFSGSYDDTVVVEDAAVTEWNMELASGEYYIAMTAFDSEGNESAYSNEIVRSVD